MYHRVNNGINYRNKHKSVQRNLIAVADIERCKKEYPDDDGGYVGNYVHGKYCQFFDELVQGATKHLPNVKLYMDAISTSKYSVIVYYEDDYTEMGRLSTTYYKGELKYCVESHLIQNNRYCRHNSPDEFYTLSSQSLQKAISNARKYLRPNNMADILNCTHRTVENKVMDTRSDVQTAKREATKNAGFDNACSDRLPEVANIMLDMYHKGLVKVDSKTSDELDLLHESMEKYRALRHTDHEIMHCVWVKPNNEVHVHDVDCYYKHGSSHLRTKDGMDPYDKGFGRQVRVVSHNEVPEDVLNKVSVLDVLGVNDFAYDVGIKISDSVYYVRKDDKSSTV